MVVGNREIESDRIVIARRSHLTPIPFNELPVRASDALFALNEVPPKSLLVIRGRFIGCEMSAFFAGLGVDTHIFARGGRLLGREDGEIEQVFQSEFEREVRCRVVLILQRSTSRLRSIFSVPCWLHWQASPENTASPPNLVVLLPFY